MAAFVAWNMEGISGRNWVLSEIMIVDGKQLEEVGEAALALKRYPTTAPFQDGPLKEMQLLAATIKEAIHRLIMVPTILGAKRTHINHKLYGFLQSLRLESCT